MVVDPQAPELTLGDFRSLAMATNTCLLLHDADTKRILWANPAASDLLGWSVAELRPLTASDMSSSAQQYDRVLGRAWLQVAAETGVNRIEWHYRTRDGRVIPTEAVAVRVELDQGPALLVHFRDIEREQAVERQLRLTTSYVESLAQHTSTIAVMLDAEGVVRFATDTALAALGAPAEREPGRIEELARITAGGATGSPVGWDEAAAAAAPVTHVQLDVTRPGGERAWLEGTLEAVQGGDEQDGFLMILHDVSDRVHGQLRRQRELHQENYLARYNAMGDMAMAIAHELGQPLAAAYNFLAGAAARARTAGAPEATPQADPVAYGIASATTQIERARAIVNALRSFVGHLEQIEREEDLNEIVDECLHFVQLRAADAGVEVRVDLAPEPVHVRCERVLTGQVLLNLCFNAVDALAGVAPEQRRLTITTRDEGGSGLLTVDDAGPGLTRDPFEQSFTSKEHGSGIGLALTYRIVTRQHGTIWAERSPDGGSRFAVRLPRSAPRR